VGHWRGGLPCARVGAYGRAYCRRAGWGRSGLRYHRGGSTVPEILGKPPGGAWIPAARAALSFPAEPDDGTARAGGGEHLPIAGATEAFGVLRYRGNGALDTSFGAGGRATATFTNFLNSPNDVALQADGKIVVVGNAQSADGTVSEFAVAVSTRTGPWTAASALAARSPRTSSGSWPGGVQPGRLGTHPGRREDPGRRARIHSGRWSHPHPRPLPGPVTPWPLLAQPGWRQSGDQACSAVSRAPAMTGA
jgi:hypothetical protein